MSHLRLLLCLVVAGYLLFGQAPTPNTKPVSYDSEHTRWVAATLNEIQTVKVGMTRAELLKVFTTEGGLSTVEQRRYVFRDCPYIKVDVTFSPTQPGQHEEWLTDKITSISKPFLEFTIID